jgi:hypothetical protein
MKRIPLLAFIVALLAPGSVLATDLSLTLRFLGPDDPSPFGSRLWVQITNDSFTSVALVEKMQSSELLVDGRSHFRQTSPFTGPPGLAIKSTWEGCLPLKEYLPDDLPPGSHRLQFRMGQNVSEEVHVYQPHREAAATTPPARLKQAKALARILTPGLLKSCVENWLTEEDGGLQDLERVRYYLEPDVKVLVPYDQGTLGLRVKEGVRVYSESRMLD